MTVRGGAPSAGRLLVLGGTLFLGRHVVEAALARGLEVVIANRGRTDPGDWPALARVRRVTIDRDREGDVSALAAVEADAVVDCSGYDAVQVSRAARALAAGPSAAAHLVFVSSVSAHAACPPGRDYDEDAPLAAGEDGYAAGKARAEEALATAWPPGRWSIVRPGLVVGPQDPTGRFTYWPLRAARGGEVLAPGPASRQVQVIDGRDLATFCVELAVARRAGTFIATGPRVSMGEVIEACAGAARDAALAAGEAPLAVTPAWRDDAALQAAGVVPWTGLPLWIPQDDPDAGGLMRAVTTRARDAGLRTRPLRETAADTLAWARSPGARTPRQVPVLTPQDEARVLHPPATSPEP